MYAKSSIVLAFIAASAQVAFAAPPACLLAAVNAQPSLSDYKSICGSSDFHSTLKDACGDSYKAAASALKSTCDDKGEETNTKTSSASASTSASVSKHVYTMTKGSHVIVTTKTGVPYAQSTGGHYGTGNSTIHPSGTGVSGGNSTAPTAPVSPNAPGTNSANGPAGAGSSGSASPSSAAGSSAPKSLQPLAGSFAAAAVLVGAFAIAL